LEGRVSNIPGPVKLLNCYNPYKERAPFWKWAKDSGCLDDDSLIIGGSKFHTFSSGSLGRKG
jgi:hypothetical protein